MFQTDKSHLYRNLSYRTLEVVPASDSVDHCANGRELLPEPFKHNIDLERNLLYPANNRAVFVWFEYWIPGGYGISGGRGRRVGVERGEVADASRRLAVITLSSLKTRVSLRWPPELLIVKPAVYRREALKDQIAEWQVEVSLQTFCNWNIQFYLWMLFTWKFACYELCALFAFGG